MKAMILAAGLGTRLRPHTLHTPKPLFPIGDKPLLERILERLAAAGCRAVMINTHHLADAIEARVSKLELPMRVETRYEPRILGTGGALKNVADFWGNQPLLVINGDIDTNLDMAALYRHHLDNPCYATMAVHDHPPYNNVIVDSGSRIAGFLGNQESYSARTGNELLAYTGIQVVDPRVARYIAPGEKTGIISVYRRGLESGWRINAYRVEGLRWHDIGTPGGYRRAVIDHWAPRVFAKLKGKAESLDYDVQNLEGDGSDRRWFRLISGKSSTVVADHGIRPPSGVVEADAFVSIGRHLKSKAVPVPEILLYDRFCGLVFTEDLGDRNLHQEVCLRGSGRIESLYREVVEIWAHMAVNGAEGFDPGWTWQTSHYDKKVILENECRYFQDRFLKLYLGLNVADSRLEDDFSRLADLLLDSALPGLIHRDFQSRNIMLTINGPKLIDFQGARLGPVQYDLASLLIDPYTNLDPGLKKDLLTYALECLGRHLAFDKGKFLRGYRLCAVSRNLQILGAFAFLSRIKGKPFFKAYIRPAVAALLENLEQVDAAKTLPALWQTACRAAELTPADRK